MLGKQVISVTVMVDKMCKFSEMQCIYTTGSSVLRLRYTSYGSEISNVFPKAQIDPEMTRVSPVCLIGDTHQEKSRGSRGKQSEGIPESDIQCQKNNW